MTKKILIVDDASLIRNVTHKAAIEAGYETVLANDGQAGIDALKDNKFDLIFSDINMPIMGGLEMIEKIRELEEYRFVPIVMLTTESKSELKKRAQELGVKAWLLKPFNKEKFLLVLNKLLG
ncbi:MAG: response regulator [Sulfurimonas sp.]|nr:response regulator [Sulfurimonas sp.]